MLEDERITKHPKIQGALYFPTEDGPIYLDQLPQKRCYAYYSLSSTLYLLGKENAARAYADKARALQAFDEVSIKALVAYDLQRLQETFPSRASQIEQYRATLR